MYFELFLEPGGGGEPALDAYLQRYATQDIKRAVARVFIATPVDQLDTVAGFYTLSEAPWVIVLFAPGERILAPILKFRLYFALAGVFCVLVILSMIQLLGGRLTALIRELSLAAKRVETGDYGSPLPVNRSDEVGRLVESFNRMVAGSGRW